jgi:carbon monoxide dehydrogenase subunit G
VKFENGFTTQAPADEVFEALMDVRGVATCLPGATVGDETDDGGLEATVAVKVGPIRMTYAGTMHVTERDDAARTASMNIKAREQRGQGNAEANVGLAVTGIDGGSQATITTDLMVTGRVAQMGAGIMQEVANAMVAQFAECLQSKLAPAPPAAPAAAANGAAQPQDVATAAPPQAPAAPAQAEAVRPLGLVMKAVWARIKRAFGGGR